MTLEEFLLNIHVLIYNYSTIITDDIRLQNVLSSMKRGINIFECIKIDDDPGFLCNKSLDALKELGRYLILQKTMKDKTIKKLTYPLILCILFALQSLLLSYYFKIVIFIPIIITPIIIIMGYIFIQQRINKKIIDLLKLYWMICLLKRTINIQNFLKINNIKKLNNLDELVYEMTGSSLINIEMMEERYHSTLNYIIESNENSYEILSKISIISIGSSIIYIMIKIVGTLKKYML